MSLETARRSPADWKHLGDCGEHSHILYCWQRFDSALWSDGFDLSRRASVQLPGSSRAAEKDRAGRSRRWMVPRLLMGALLTANVWVVLKCNQLVDALGSKKTLYCFLGFFLEGGAIGCAWCGTTLRRAISRPCSLILLKISTMQNTITSPSSFHPQHAGQRRSC